MEKSVLISKCAAGFLIATLALASSCSPQEEVKDAVDDFTVISGSLEERDGNRLDGTARIRFLSTFASPFSTQNFEIKAVLPENNSSLTLISHSASRLMADGIQLRFSRSLLRLQGEIEVNGAHRRQITDSRLVGLSPSGLNILVQVHNADSAKARILIWTDLPPSPVPANAVFDSEVAGHLDSPMAVESASGVFYGLELSNASVSHIALRP